MIDIKHHPDTLTERIIGAAMDVHSHLGPGLLESVYQFALEQELTARGLSFVSEVRLPVRYKGLVMERMLRMDLVVEDAVVVEIKAVDSLLPVHQAQTISYLRLSGLHRALLINFNVSRLMHGVRRFVSNPGVANLALR